MTPVSPIQPRGSNAGALINVNAPTGAKSLKPVANTPGNYAETLASGGISIPGVPGGGGDPDGYLVAGNYTFNNGAGGTDVGAFNASFTMPAVLNWTNKAAINTVDRTAGVTVNWTGGDPSGFVQIYGYSYTDTSDNPVTGFFLCVERTSAGSFNVPAAVLLALPATPSGGTGFVPTGTLAVGTVSNPVTFTAPGLDAAATVAVALTAKSVNYQ